MFKKRYKIISSNISHSSEFPTKIRFVILIIKPSLLKLMAFLPYFDMYFVIFQCSEKDDWWSSTCCSSICCLCFCPNSDSGNYRIFVSPSFVFPCGPIRFTSLHFTSLSLTPFFRIDWGTCPWLLCCKEKIKGNLSTNVFSPWDPNISMYILHTVFFIYFLWWWREGHFFNFINLIFDLAVVPLLEIRC